MNKYKLININTKEEQLCDKVTAEDGFCYYVSEGEPFAYAYIKHKNEVIKVNRIGETSGAVYHDKGFNYPHECQKVVATNNSNIDIPMVIDAVQVFAETKVPDGFRTIWKSGYNKSQKTHPFSLDDVKEIISLAREQYWDIDNRGFSSNTEGDWSFKYSTEDEIIQKYQETKVLTIFYE